MDRAAALERLGLSEQESLPASIESALARRTKELEERAAGAPTESLRQKYLAEQVELDEIRAILQPAAVRPSLLSSTQFQDLPAAKPAFTSDGRDASTSGSSVAISEGQVLLGRYEVRRRLGAGGMGAVHAAYDRNAREEIAIKFLLPALVSSPDARERFLGEGQASRRLAHPNIVRVYDVQSEGALHFLTMELLEGRSLREELDRRRRESRPVPLEEALRIGRALCGALAHAHPATVHRDVKPENVWLCPDGTVKLLDFGVARLLRTSQLTRAGTALGTAYYMAPEQLQGAAEADGRADQYSVAVVLYEMLTGRVPTGRARSARELRRDVPRGLSAALDRALSSEPDDRFPDMAAFEAALLARSRIGKLPASTLPIAAALLLALVTAGSAGHWAPALRAWVGTLREDPQRVMTAALEAQGRARLRGERLDEARRELEERVEKAKGEERRLLELVHERVEEDVFASQARLDLEAHQNTGDAFLRERDYRRALATFVTAEKVAVSLRDAIPEIEKLVRTEDGATRVLTAWDSLLKRTKGSDNAGSAAARARMTEAEAAAKEGKRTEAAEKYEEARIVLEKELASLRLELEKRSARARDPYGWTPLQDAVFERDYEKAERLLNLGALVDVPQAGMGTPLHRAVCNGDEGIAQLLVDRGASAKWVPADGMSMMECAIFDHPHLVGFLLRNGAKPDGITFHNKWSFVYAAAQRGRWGAMRLLVEAGANPDGKGPSGETALFLTAHHGHSDEARFLVQHGANVNVRSGQRGWTPLKVAVLMKRDSVAAYLRSQGGIE